MGIEEAKNALAKFMQERLERDLFYGTTSAVHSEPLHITKDTLAEWSRLLKQTAPIRDEFPKAPWGGLQITILDKQQQARTPYHIVNVTPSVRTRKEGRKCSRKQAKRLRGMVRMRSYAEPMDVLKTPSGFVMTPRQSIAFRQQAALSL